MAADGRGSRILLLVLAGIIVAGIGVFAGAAIEGEGSDGNNAVQPLGASGIGDSSQGRELFVSQGCALCHSYLGRGGTDGPALDFMRGRLAATDIAEMSGRIWNHVPAMQAAFAEEGVPFPTFKAGEMADLIAYLHGGGDPPDVADHGGMMEDHGGGGMMEDHGGDETTPK